MLILPDINFEIYKEACVSFAQDTIDWYEMDEHKFYTTDGCGWLETSDNAHVGFDVRWCFHMDFVEIEERYLEEYLHHVSNAEQLLEDQYDDWSAEDKYQYIKWLNELKSGIIIN